MWRQARRIQHRSERQGQRLDTGVSMCLSLSERYSRQEDSSDAYGTSSVYGPVADNSLVTDSDRVSAGAG